MKHFVIGILAVLALVFLLGCATEKAKDNNFLIDNNSQLVGNDKDAHGCIPSAGYSWCELKQKCLRVWEEKCEAVACTMEAKMCPDGITYVGRTAPNCNFAPCPDLNEHICTAEEKSATMCTLEYMPVCGKSILNAGVVTYSTYGNKCGACAGMKVVSYVPGECPYEGNSTQIANPASVNCRDHNGTLKIVDTNEGQIGMCTLPGGKECEEWAYFRGEC